MVALQFAVIFAIIVFKLAVLGNSTEVRLRISPVDPRDFLRGDYASFQYDISNIAAHRADSRQIKNGETIYVVLRQAGKYHVVLSTQKNKPIDNKLFIKGKVVRGGLGGQPAPRFRSRLSIVYGIEQYFIPEGAGRNFSFRNKEAFALVAIDDNGNAILKRIYVNDKPWP